MTRRKLLEYMPSGEVLYKLYWEEMGLARSYVKVRKWCASNGYRNPKTGKAPAPMAPFWRMWRWALEKKNFETAYEIYNKAQIDEGNFVTRQQFKEFLDDKALTVFRVQRRMYEKYMSGNL